MQITDKPSLAAPSDPAPFPIVLKFVQSEVPPAPSIELNKTLDE